MLAAHVKLGLLGLETSFANLGTLLRGCFAGGRKIEFLGGGKRLVFH
jgi:hypothetical protein